MKIIKNIIFILVLSISFYTLNVDAASLCKRATTLHNDGTHTFGNLGSGTTLTAGDAFDCDVNGDGTYDPATERFYYVTDLDSNTAVLIYYNNTYNGIPNNETAVSYDSDDSWHGPRNAVLKLPTTSQWKTTVLSSPRQIKTEVGTTSTEGGYLPQFDYSSYAARLLTYQEVQSACGTGEPTFNGYLDNCTYLMENTKYSSDSYTYGYWLESPYASYTDLAWNVRGDTRYIGYGMVLSVNNFGVRPAIEVKKEMIEDKEETIIDKNSSSTNKNNTSVNSDSNKKETVKVDDTLKTTYMGFIIGVSILILGCIVIYDSIYKKKTIKNEE